MLRSGARAATQHTATQHEGVAHERTNAIGRTMIETHDLRRTFKTRGGEVDAVQGVDLDGRRGGGLRLPRSQRRRQDDDPADAGDAPAADVGGEATVAGARPRAASRRGPRAHRLRPAGRLAPIRRRPAGASSSSRAGCTAWTAATRPARAAEVLDALDLEEAADRDDQHLLRRHAPPAGRRPRHRPSAGRPLPRRADHRPRPAGPGRACGTRSASSRDAGTTVFLTTHYLEEADALSDRLAIIDHGRIVAEGTADELKRQIAGDVVTIGVDGAGRARARRSSAAQPFVREATLDGDLVRLYVDQGEAAVPQLLRVLDGAGLRAQTI